MSTPATLAVQIGDRWHTPETSDLTWTKTAPGGCLLGEAEIVDAAVRDIIVPGSQVAISNPATGRIVFDGAVRDPSPRSGGDGKRTGKVSVSGSVQRLYDAASTYPYVARGPSAWVDEDYTRDGGQVTGSVSSEMVTDGGDFMREALVLQMKQEDAPPFRKARARCVAFDASAMTLGAILYGLTSRFTPGSVAPWAHRAFTGVPGGPTSPFIIVDDLPVLPAWEPVLVGRAGVTAGLAVGQRELRVQLLNDSLVAAGVNTDNYRIELTGLAVLGDRVDVDGTRQAEMLTTPHYVLAHQVVRDVLGRVGIFDPARVDLATSARQIEHLWFDSPTRLGQVLDTTLGFEPTWRWIMPAAAFPSSRPFVCGPWPDAPRYVLEQDLGQYDEQVREDEVYNRVTVRFQGVYGRWQSYTTPVADPDLYPATRALADAGIVREPEPIVLGSAGGSLANAQLVGDAMLSEFATLSVAATFGTAQSVLDLSSGVRVHPWEVEPGYTAMVQHTGEVFRVTQSVCDGHAGTANLTLGTPARTVEQILARTVRRGVGSSGRLR